MKWFFRFFQQIRDWLYLWFVPPYKTQFVEGDLPDKLLKKMVYIVREDGYLWHASMLCPCGCGEVLHLNLIPDEHPCWRLTEHANGTVGLYPSIWRKKGCYSHFWLQTGHVIWCKS